MRDLTTLKRKAADLTKGELRPRSPHTDLEKRVARLAEGG